MTVEDTTKGTMTLPPELEKMVQDGEQLMFVRIRGGNE